MVFSSPIFLFLFLPIVLLLILVIRKEFRNLVLLLASLLFYAWGEGEIVILMLISILFNYLFGFFIDKSRSKKSARIILAIAVIFNIGLLAFFKYANFFIDNLNFLFNYLKIKPIQFEKIHLPIGISFFTFQAMSYVIDVFRKETEAQKNPINIALYISFFPQLIAGPIVRYHDVAKQILNRSMNINKFSSGIQRFVFGLGKKVLIANTMALVVDNIFKIPSNEMTFILSWIGIISYALQIYFDFSGYSDMAIGLGRMFGFEFLENFNYPYIAQSIKDFWRRWHISLSTWFRDYLYIPLGGNRKGAARTYLHLGVVFFVTGLWHGASWNFIIWGLFHGLFLIIERIGFDKVLKRVWLPIRHFYTLLIVLIGWVLFRSETLTYSLGFLKGMIGLNGFISDLHYPALYINNEVIIVLIIGIIFSTPLYKKVKQYYFKIIEAYSEKLIKFFDVMKNIIKLTSILVIFILSVMSLASGTYNPFIYFRF